MEKKIEEKDMRDGLTEQEETGRGGRKSMWTKGRRTGGGRKTKSNQREKEVNRRRKN